MAENAEGEKLEVENLELDIRAEDFKKGTLINIILSKHGSEIAGPVIATLSKLRGGKRIDVAQLPYVMRGALKRKAHREREKHQLNFFKK